MAYAGTAQLGFMRLQGGDDTLNQIGLGEFYAAARMDLFRLAALERRIAEILGRRVDLLPEPVQQPRLQANIDRDRRRAFFSNAVLPYDAPPPRNSPE